MILFYRSTMFLVERYTRLLVDSSYWLPLLYPLPQPSVLTFYPVGFFFGSILVFVAIFVSTAHHFSTDIFVWSPLFLSLEEFEILRFVLHERTSLFGV